MADSNVAGDLKKLKQEADALDRDDEKKQKNRSFAKIQGYVADELAR